MNAPALCELVVGFLQVVFLVEVEGVERVLDQNPELHRSLVDTLALGVRALYDSTVPPDVALPEAKDNLPAPAVSRAVARRPTIVVNRTISTVQASSAIYDGGVA